MIYSMVFDIIIINKTNVQIFEENIQININKCNSDEVTENVILVHDIKK